MERNHLVDMPIAIIGMSCRLPGADNLNQYWQMLCEGKCGIVEAPPHKLDIDLFYHPEKSMMGKTYSKLCGLVPERPIDLQLYPSLDNVNKTYDQTHLTMLEVATEAIKHAGLDPFNLRLKNTGVYIDIQDIIKQRIVDEIHNNNPTREYNQKCHILPNDAAAIISDAFGLSGPYMVVDAACVSSLYALITAVNALLHGRIDMAIVGGAANTNWQNLILFSQAQALSANGSFPFDSRADGFISSDGYAAILIKTLKQAVTDKDTIYGVIRGIGISNNGHGTSTQLGDATEIEALSTVFSDCFPKGTQIPIASVKANIGHTLEAAGLAGLIKVLLSMQNETIPAAINVLYPSPKIDWKNIPFFVPTIQMAWPVHEDGYPRCAALDSFGIGGLNVHLVLEQYSPRKNSVNSIDNVARIDSVESVDSADSVDRVDSFDIFRMGGQNLEDLMKRMPAFNVDPHSLIGLSNMFCYHPDDGARMAIVFKNNDDFAQKLKLAANHVGQPGLYSVLTEKGIFYHMSSQNKAHKPRLAFIFCGLGSQYPGMLRELVHEIPAAADQLKEMDELMSQMGYPTFSEIAWSGDESEKHKLDSNVWSTQMSILFADMICYAALRDMGIIPSVISGHSYGELPALVAAGAWTLEQAIKMTHLRSQVINSSAIARGALLSTTASWKVIRRLAKKMNGNIYLANHNAPIQTIIGGNKDSVSEINSLLTAHGFKNKLLPVPSPFHTPLMIEAQEQLRQSLEKEKFFPPQIPFLSSITNRYTSEPADICRNLGNQLTKPVHYVDLIEKLLNDEIKIILEVGPRQVLTRLHRRIIKDRDVVAISCDNPKNPGKSQLIHIKAMLECCGILNLTDKTIGDWRQPQALSF